MITPENLKLLQQLKGTTYGQALLVFLGEEYNKINDVKVCKSFDEVLGRKYALETLDRLFSVVNGKVPDGPPVVGKKGYE